MPNVLILTLVFTPDNVSTAHVMAGLAEDLVTRGHKVCVITTTPHYNDDPNLLAKQQLRPWFFNLIKKSDYKGIPAYHILMPSKKCAAPIKIVSWIAFHALSTLLSLIIGFKPDVVVAPSPPLSIGINAYVIALLRRARYIYNVQELYPDIAINLGFLKNGLLIKLLQMAERFIYNKSAAVTSISEAMCRKIVARTKVTSKVHLIPNFVDFGDVKPCPRDNDFSKEFGIAGQFVITYAGNMGVAQNLFIVVEAAKLLKHDKGITFLLIGSGSEKAKLLEEVNRAQLTNVRVIDYQPYSRMPAIYGSSDLFYVGQTPEAHSDGIPSKIYRIMANAKPLLVATESDSDLATLVKAADGGMVIATNDPRDLANAIAGLKCDPTQVARLGANAREYVSSRFERHIVNSQYDALIRDVASR